MGNKINFIALAAGISSLILVAISFFVPWWKFTFGSPANVQVNFSPVNVNFAHSGAAVNIPLIWALNVACLLTLLAGGIILTIYAVKPTKPYSKNLLGFGYKKPLFTLVAFIVILIAVPIRVTGLCWIQPAHQRLRHSKPQRRKRQRQRHNSFRVAVLLRHSSHWAKRCGKGRSRKNS